MPYVGDSVDVKSDTSRVIRASVMQGMVLRTCVGISAGQNEFDACQEQAVALCTIKASCKSACTAVLAVVLGGFAGDRDKSTGSVLKT